MLDRRPRILAFAGSLRKDSYNRRLLRYAVAGAVGAGGEVEELSPGTLQLPLYNGDLERDGTFPPEVEAWRATIRLCDGMLIGSSEYNHGTENQLAVEYKLVKRAIAFEGFADPSFAGACP